MLPKRLAIPLETDRANRIASGVANFVAAGETVLDVGCGSMLIAQLLQNLSGARVFGADVIHLNSSDLSSCLCRGERLSFAGNSVDIICLIFVLHHTQDPLDALRESLRVARRKIIILEDVYQGPLELTMLKLLDWAGNRLISADISLPFHFKTESEWKMTFRSLGMRLAAVEGIRPVPWLPARYRLFVLDKQ